MDKFDDVIQDKLDEWIYFLKHGELPDNFSAKGLNEAKKKLNEMNLTEEEKIAYNAYLSNLRDLASAQHTQIVDAQQLIKEGIKEGEDKKEKEAIMGMYSIGIPVQQIAQALNISEEKVQWIIEHEQKK